MWTGGVQALLDTNCVKCHGPLRQKGGLELDNVEAVLKGGDEGLVIDKKSPDQSKLLTALAAGSDPHMPPKRQLAEPEVAQIRAFVTALASGEPVKKAERVPDPPASFDVSQAVDYFLEAGWKSRSIKPAPRCDDLTFVRRVHLDLAGRLPKPEEVSAFLSDKGDKKREALVDRLLASKDYPVAMRETWDALLMGRRTGGRLAKRRNDGWFAFLEGAFKANRPWNEVVRAFITARPEKPEDKGASCFLFERKDAHQDIAEAVAPVIYGTRIDCAQCHDHPLAREIKQAHYWGLVAAFNRGKNVDEPAVSEAATGGFINFVNLRKESQPAAITMLTGQTIAEARPAADAKEDDKPDAYVDPKAKVKVPKFSRRAALAEAATSDNPLLAKSFVNHTWAILFGRGIVHPVDEINSKHPASHPELLEWLARDFAAHNYDMRRLIRSLVLSQGYQLAAPAGEAPVPEAFAAAMEKPLIAETLYRSAMIVGGVSVEDPKLKTQFLDTFPDVLPRTPRSTVQQATFVETSEAFSALFKTTATAAPASAPQAAPKPLDQHVRDLFRRALVRDPDAEELQHATDFLHRFDTRPAEGDSQLLWALVTGPEFLTNH